MIEMYGPDILDKLELAKKQTVKFTQFELDEITKHYRKLVKQMKLNRL